MKNYEELLKNAPDQTSTAFIEYLRQHNKVVWEDSYWLVIENFKYHKPDAPWLTAFWKNPFDWTNPYNLQFNYFTPLQELYGDWQWIKKAPENQTVPGRFHFHLVKHVSPARD